TFVFLSFRDSAPNQPGVVGNGGFVADQGLGKRDIITDFVSGVDRIDLSAIDANTHIAGNQKFGWKGAAGFSFSAGELVYKTFNFAGTANDQTIIYGDIDGNGAADFQIQLKGIKTLSAADFVL
ncbi:MAG TPA: M10 family metallopeptidase C-terminal domain-containing protein, partial [Rhizobiaceae bacterium]|nr:M10 family metallopeptidase C-terminal domain-containing protein [Rhizobiaceae bacterium]